MNTDPTPHPEDQSPQHPPAEPTPESAEASRKESPAAGPNEEKTESEKQESKILIGSQRNPEAYRPKPTIPVTGRVESTERKTSGDRPAKLSEDPQALESVEEDVEKINEGDLKESRKPPKKQGGGRVPVPSLRSMSDDLQEEFDQLFQEDENIEELLGDVDKVAEQEVLEPESKHEAKVVGIRREDVFVELPGREQGLLALKQFDEEPPEVGETLEVVVVRFLAGEGLYELTLPFAAASVGDWSSVKEGMVVEAQVTGHNTGGLECEVNQLRGFIPISQVAIYRVENLEEFVGEKMTCLVTEVNPQRRNLVLSRRALLEREREEARKQLLDELEPGQEREGVVRKIMDFGAFVDLGGVDGLIHISELSWGRVAHPSEVLTEGQPIKVRVLKVDLENNRIGLAYRDKGENPWHNVRMKYPENSTVRGRVVKIMEFGAFVELEPGVEGLVHISELDHKKVWRVADVVEEGQEVDVLVQSVDPENQRISLSMKDLMDKPVSASSEKEEKEDASMPEPADAAKIKKKQKGPLKGGIGRDSGGDRFGLKW